MKNIIWKPLKNYEGLYEISNTGKIKSLYKNRILKDSLTKYGYYQVQLFKNKQYKQYLVHRLVAENFIENPENKPQINHINALKTDNRVTNLEWVTSAENMNHAKKLGLLKGNEKSKYNACKKVKDTITGIVYPSLKQASLDLNIKYSILRSMLSKKQKNTTSLIYLDSQDNTLNNY